MLGEKEKIEIDGYTPFFNNNKSGKGGIIIAVQNELKDVTIETGKTLEEYQTLWVKIDNGNNKINVGCVYAPQEKDTKVAIYNQMYNHIKDKVIKSKQDNERVIITGDFNAKVGETIQGNNKVVSKSGKILLKMALENDLAILNKSTKCQGKWTRMQGNEKSILDYILIFQEDEQYIEHMEIDEDKIHTPGYKEKSRTVYSDHCAMICSIRWTDASIDRKEAARKKVMTEKSLTLFQERTQTGNLANIMRENTDLSARSVKWLAEVQSIMDATCEVKKEFRDRPLKIVRKLNNLKKKVRMKTEWSVRKRKHQVRRINEIIEDEIKQHKARSTIEKAKKLQSDNKMHSGTFWEFKKQMDRTQKGETPSVMLDKNGEEKTSKEEIKKIFEEFYEDLFQPTVPTTETEKMAEKVTNQVFEEIMRRADKPCDKEPITKDEIRNSIRMIKNQATIDYNKINNKILKNAGNDFIESLEILFNEINNSNIGLAIWEHMLIKSIHKGKSKKEMNNRRGLFITSVVSKLFEKTKRNRQRSIIENSISKFQTGGITGKSTVDNTMVLNATIDYNNFINSETYVFFADAYKCFDKLDLKTSLIDLYEILGEHEAKLFYNLNRRAKITIQTPVGDTNPIEVKEITKQGTIYGPILCDINTDKVNSIGTKNITTIGPDIECMSLIYVDDIEHGGSHLKSIERAASNCNSMEQLRKYIFNNEVEKTAFMIIKPKKGSKNIEELETQVKRGKIKRTREYKYVGNWYNEKYNHETSIKAKAGKVPGIITQMKYYGDSYKVGNMVYQVRMQIFESTVVPTIYHNVETWSKITKKEIEQLERMQKDILTDMMDLPKSTPYFGLLSELGVWPFEQLLAYKRIMLLHQILTSDDNRFLKEVIIDQIRSTYPGCWIEQTKEICHNLNLSIQLIRCMKKGKLKSILKKRIQQRLERRIEVESKEKTKLRFCGDFKRKKYLLMGNLNKNMVKGIIKARLNMLELSCNYKGANRSEICSLCKKEKDTTEHLFECREISKNIAVPNIEILKQNSEEAYYELGDFLTQVCQFKGINLSKTVKENFDNIFRKQEESKVYQISSFDKDKLKMVIREERKIYQITSFDKNDLKMVISISG